MTREAARRIERLEGENRQLKTDLARYSRATLNGSPLVRLVRLYDDLCLAADPVKGRPVETGGGQHPFDRPLVYLHTQKARGLQQVADRALRRLTEWIDRQMDDSEQKPAADACPACGGRVDRQGRPPNRRRAARLFLEKSLAAGPVRCDVLAQAASQVGVTLSTMRRAADDMGVVRYDEGGDRWWGLPAVCAPPAAAEGRETA